MVFWKETIMNSKKRMTKDSYANVMTGLGDTNKDKNTGLKINDQGVLTDEYLSSVYAADGIGTVIVDVVANDATKNGWTYKEDKEDKIKKELKRLGFKKAVNTALKYQRLYRGSIIVMVTERGDLDEELTQRSGAVTRLKVYSAARMNTMSSTDFITDPKDKYWDEPEFFKVRPLNGSEISIHRSRCLVFKGELVPDDSLSDYDLTYQYWGLSVLQRAHKRLAYYGAAEQGISNLMQELGLGVFTFENLAQILSHNKEEAMKKIVTRLEAINAAKSTIKSVIIGANEKFERVDANLSNVGDVMDRFMMGLSCVTSIPVSKLFGRSAAGMNATGEGDLTNYYDMVRDNQEDIQAELDILVKQVGISVYGGDPEKYGIDEFVSLWEPSEKEKAETEKIKAETYQLYTNMGVITPEYVEENEFPELQGQYLKREEEKAKEFAKQLEEAEKQKALLAAQNPTPPNPQQGGTE